MICQELAIEGSQYVWENLENRLCDVLIPLPSEDCVHQGSQA